VVPKVAVRQSDSGFTLCPDADYRVP